jgi:DNA-binding CsgD family transcriptional regulator
MRSPKKYTPECLDKIKALVAEGKHREEIAQIIGTSIGSLQVTCSRARVSLRNSTTKKRGMKKKNDANGHKPVLTLPSNGHTMVSQVPIEFKIELVMQYRGQERIVPITIDRELFADLALEAHFRGMCIIELIAKILENIVSKELYSDVLQS